MNQPEDLPGQSEPCACTRALNEFVQSALPRVDHMSQMLDDLRVSFDEFITDMTAGFRALSAQNDVILDLCAEAERTHAELVRAIVGDEAD